MLMELRKNTMQKGDTKHVLLTASFASSSLEGIFSKGRSLSAWPGRDLQHVSALWAAGTSLCFVCSTTHCFSQCMGEKEQ